MLKSVLSDGGLKALAYDVGPGRYYQPAYRNIASAIDLEAGAFLDIGCGPGWLSIYVASGKPELDAIGIDINEAMLQRAERHKGTRLNVTYHTMDAAQIIYPEGTFNAVAAVQSAHHWTDTAAVLEEVYRVLKPGCSFYLYEADAEASEVPDGWIQRQGVFPPDAWVLRNWKRYGMDATRWEELKQAVRASSFGGGEAGRHGFYRRLVLTK